MNYLFPVILLWVLVINMAQAQDIPNRPNKTNKKGKRQGEWIILYDKSWETTTDTSLAVYYRLIEYKKDKPVGIFQDYYLSGQVQKEGYLLSDQPLVKDGHFKWYREDGTLRKQIHYSNGKKIDETLYNTKGEIALKPPLDWEEEVFKAIDYVKIKKYDSTLFLLEKHFEALPYELNDEELYSLLTVLKISYGKSKNKTRFKRTKAYIKQLDQKWYVLTRKGTERVAFGKFREAKTFFQQAKKQAGIEFGLQHSNYALSCNNLGRVYAEGGKLDTAEILFKQAMSILQSSSGKQSAEYAFSCSNLSNLYIIHGKYQEAKKLCVLANRILKHAPHDLFYINTLAPNILLNIKAGNFEEAKEQGIKAKKILQKLYHVPTIYHISINNMLANAYYGNSQYDSAAIFFQESKQYVQKIKKTYWWVNLSRFEAQIAYGLGLISWMKGNFKQSEEQLLRAKKLAQMEKKHPFSPYIDVVNSLGLLYITYGLFEKAEKTLHAVKLQAQSVFGIFHSAYQTANINFAYILFHKNQYQKAYEIVINIKKVQETQADTLHPELAGTYNLLAKLYDTQHQYDSSEYYYLKAISIVNNFFKKENRYFAQYNIDLAAFYIKQGRFVEAETSLDTAASIFENILGIENHDMVTVYLTRAEWFYVQGQYEKAEPLYFKAIKLFEKLALTNHPNHAVACNNLASLYIELGFFEKSALFFDKARSFYKVQQPIPFDRYAHTSMGLGFALYMQSKVDSAKTYLLEAKQVYEENDATESIGYANTCRFLGILYANQKQYDLAEKRLLLSKEVFEKTVGKHHLAYPYGCQYLGLFYFSRGEYQKAAPLLAESQQLLQNKASIENDKRNGFALFWLGTNTFWAGNRKKAQDLWLAANKIYLSQLNHNVLFLSEKEKNQFFQSFNHVFNAFNYFTITRQELDGEMLAEMYNNVLATKGMLFNAMRQNQRYLFKKDDRTNNIYKDWLAHRKRLAHLYSTASPSLKTKHDLDTLEEQTNYLEKQLSQRTKTYQFDQFTWKDVQKKLKVNEAAVEIIKVIGDQSFAKIDTSIYVALIIKSDTLKYPHPKAIILGNGSKIEAIYQNYYRKKVEHDLEVDEHIAYRYLWAKIATQLKGVQHLYLSVDGIYQKINILALQQPSGIYVAEDSTLDIQLVTSTKDILLPKRIRKPTANIYLVGNPNYTQKQPNDTKIMSPFGYLAGTEKIVANIEAALGSNSIKIIKLTGNNATEQNISKVQSPKLLHIGTHSSFTPKDRIGISVNENGLVGGILAKLVENPLLRTRLAFAGANHAIHAGGDGLLTAYEVLNLDLRDTELVTLSACNSGLGDIQDGEGVFGLQRAFKLAGTETLLMSLWPVSDEPTTEFMTQFYHNWLVKKQSKREAFRNAQKYLREGDFPEPYFWASFVMVGE